MWLLEAAKCRPPRHAQIRAVVRTAICSCPDECCRPTDGDEHPGRGVGGLPGLILGGARQVVVGKWHRCLYLLGQVFMRSNYRKRETFSLTRAWIMIGPVP